MTQDERQEYEKPSRQRTVMAHVLVTGFEPFGNNERNISMEVLASLPMSFICPDPWSRLRARELEPIHVTLDTMVLTVDEKGSTTVSNLLSSGKEWDLIVHLGLCESCSLPRIETRAQNILSMRIPDNSGRQVFEQPLSQHGDLLVTAPVQAWKQEKMGDGWELSTDAGTFICNETLYRTLHTLSMPNIDSKPCLFIHLPGFEACSLEQASTLIQEVIQRMLFRPVVSVVGGLLTRDDRYLVARRAPHEKHPGKWEFPGGKVEIEETLQQAVVREFKEELGWDVSAKPSLGVWHHELAVFDIALNILPVELTDESLNLMNSSSWTAHDALAWRGIDDDSPLDWLGSDEDIVHWMRDSGYLSKSK